MLKCHLTPPPAIWPTVPWMGVMTSYKANFSFQLYLKCTKCVAIDKISYGYPIISIKVLEKL